jgi:c-di-GMP-binding flagellar brake protein YcgR
VYSDHKIILNLKKEDIKLKDRRRHPRISIMGLLRVILPGDARSREAYLANISRGGVGVYLHKDVKPGQKIAIMLYLKDKAGQEKEEKINTRVMWSGPTGDLYMAGLQFEKMAKEKYEAVLKSLFVLEQLN